MKHLIVSKVLALILVFAMLFELMPANGFATPGDEEGSQSVQQQEELLVKEEGLETNEENENSSAESETETKSLIVGEVSELREEGIKHFRMDDGSFIAVDYGMPVHFTADNGDTWENIDNTLVLQGAEKSAESPDDGDAFEPAIEIEQKYTAENGDNKISFANTLQNGFLFSSESGEYRVSISLPIGDNSANNSEKTDNSIEEIGAENTSNTNPAESGGGSETELDPDAELIEQPGEGAVTGTAPLDNPETQGEGFLVEASSEAESEAETADEPMIAETPLHETFNPLASAEISYPLEQRKQTGRGDSDGDDDNQTENDKLSLAEQVMPSRLCASVFYRNVYENVDISYNLSAFNIKESIIINNRRENYAFSFTLDVGDLTPSIQENGSIALSDEADQCIYLIPAPYMYDAAYDYSDAAAYSLERNEQGVWTLTVTADADWINAEDRVFPVTIDPTLIDQRKWNSANKTFCVSYVQEGSANTSYGEESFVYLGYRTGISNLMNQIYIGWNTLPVLPSGNEVVNAQFLIGQYSYSSYGNLSSFEGELYPLASNVSRPSAYSSNYDWIKNIKWSTKPGIGSIVQDYAVLSSAKNNEYISWDMTSLAKTWYADDSLLKVASIKMIDGNYSSSHYAYALFYGYGMGYGPLFAVNYRNVEGIEEYYSYQALGADRAGAAYISDYTGYLTTVTPLVSLSSDVNPFSINMVYNSSYFVDYSADYDVAANLGMTGMHFGSGMKLDLIQKMEIFNLQYEAGNSSTKKYLKYTDGDGTAHYFAVDTEKDPTGRTYYDEDGLGLKAVIDNESLHNFTVTNDKDSKMVFINGFLSYIEDANSNKIRIVYATSNGDPASDAHISSVKQINNGQAEVTIATFGYSEIDNVPYYLTSMADHAGNYYTFQYASNKLRTIKRQGYGEESFTQIVEFYQKYNNTYSVHENPVTGLFDSVSGYQLWFTYDGANHGRIISYREQAAGTTGAGATISRVLGKSTTYTDWGKDRSLNTTDDIITTYYFDNAGRTVNAVTRTKDGAVVGASGSVVSGIGNTDKKNNRTLRSASIGKAAMNIIRNGSFEKTGSEFEWVIDNNTNLSQSAANAAVLPDTPRTGTNALQTYLANGQTGILGAHRQTNPLSSGKYYTVSAYVNTSVASSIPDGAGVYIIVIDENSYQGWTSERLTYKTDSSIDDGWMRLSVTFLAVSSSQHTVCLCADSVPGYVYFDDVQVELGDTPSNVNLLDNGGMENWRYDWITQNTGLPDFAYGVSIDGNFSATIAGSPTDGKYIHQVVQLNQDSTQTYVLSGWAKANAVPDNVTTATGDDAAAKDGEKQFGLRAKLTYDDSTTEYHYVPFNPDVTDWQFTSLAVVPKKPLQTVVSADIICTYEKNANTVFFDNISFVKEIAQTMTYDDDGNLTSVKSTGNSAENRNYQNGNLSSVSSSGSSTYTYNYDSRHNLTSASNGVVKETYNVNDQGNTTDSTLVADNGSGPKITSHMTFDSAYSKNLKTQVTDSRGNSTDYTYSSAAVNKVSAMLGLPIKTKNAKNIETFQTYKNDGKPVMSYITSKISVENTYNSKGQLVTVDRGGYLPNSSTKLQQQYNFVYDSFGNMTNISVGNRTLASYNYGNHNGLLNRMDYGNGDRVQYTYDVFGRKTHTEIKSKKTSNYSWGISKGYSYKYNGDGQLYEMSDESNGLEYRYAYDTIGRLIGSEKKTNDSVLMQTWHDYDDHDRLTNQSWKMLDKTFKEEYTYDTHERITKKEIKLNDTSLAAINLTYGESLGRLSTVSTPVSTDYYNYLPGSGTNTTPLVSGYSHNPINGNSLSSFSYQYTYDALGNITGVTERAGTNITCTENYEYDDLGQLTFVGRHNNDFIWDCTYDYSGNIRSKTYLEGYVEQDEITYDYGNDEWRDLLTAINVSENGGAAIEHSYTYDAMGNPTKYYNLYNDVDWDLDWINGRTLQAVSIGNYNVAEYEYDVDSLRLSKNVNGTIHKYSYAGGLLLQETYTTSGGFTHTLDFVYDQNSRPFMLYYTTTSPDPAVGTNTYIYYYLLNLQGDVVRLVNSSGETIANYEYDPWGCVLSVKNGNGGYITSPDHIGNINPLRYRGYYYDTETGWYYLQSRYYDPILGRFINADIYESTGQGFLGYNMYAYCNNNPVNRIDNIGFVSEYVAAAIIRHNAATILAVGEKYNVDPTTIACCIYAEQVLNYSILDSVTDYPLFFFDTSLGVGQVKVSTAIMLEDSGYIENTSNSFPFSRKLGIAAKLEYQPEYNITCVGAYLAYWQDVWKDTNDISKSPAILATLYNLGKRANLPNNNPRANGFGRYIASNYFYVKSLLTPRRIKPKSKNNVLYQEV